MAVTAREIIWLLLGIIGSAILGLILTDIKLNIAQVKDSISIIITIIIGIGAVMVIVYRKFKEVDDELEKQKAEQKRLDEKLKIHEQLIDMKAEIKELQKIVIKNGNKK